jgi:uncharacterized protein (DUF58 family)
MISPSAWLRGRIDRFLQRPGYPEEGVVQLGQRRIYVVPSRYGWAYAVMLLLLFIASVNYSLSLGFALTFLLGGCAVVDLHMTHRNLSGLRLSVARTPSVFCGEPARLEIALENGRVRPRYALTVVCLDPTTRIVPPVVSANQTRTERKSALKAAALAAEPTVHHVDIGAHQQSPVWLEYATLQRGWSAVPRIRLQTSFPLGLIRAWSYWRPAAQVLVYPAPEPFAPTLPYGEGHATGAGGGGRDDFAGVREYRNGDPLHQLAWRQIARLSGAGNSDHDGPLVSKAFEGGNSRDVVLDYAALSSLMTVEHRLSRMTAWVLAAEQAGIPYAFRLGVTDRSSSLGSAQREACLQALALFQEPRGERT